MSKSSANISSNDDSSASSSKIIKGNEGLAESVFANDDRLPLPLNPFKPGLKFCCFEFSFSKCCLKPVFAFLGANLRPTPIFPTLFGWLLGFASCVLARGSAVGLVLDSAISLMSKSSANISSNDDSSASSSKIIKGNEGLAESVFANDDRLPLPALSSSKKDFKVLFDPRTVFEV